MPFVIVGYIVAVRQPRNPLGWILLCLAFVFTLATDGGAYAVMAYRQGYHLPFPKIAAFLAAFWIWLVLLAPLAIGLFPDGGSRDRWRPWSLYTSRCRDSSSGRPGLISPASVPRTSWSTLPVRSGAPTAARAGRDSVRPHVHRLLHSFVMRQVLAYRRSSGDQRQQLSGSRSEAVSLSSGCS